MKKGPKVRSILRLLSPFTRFIGSALIFLIIFLIFIVRSWFSEGGEGLWHLVHLAYLAHQFLLSGWLVGGVIVIAIVAARLIMLKKGRRRP